MYGVFFKLKGEEIFTEEDEKLEEVLGEKNLKSLREKREGLYLDLNLNTFQRQRHKIDDLLMEKKLFLHTFEMRKKIQILIKEGTHQK